MAEVPELGKSAAAQRVEENKPQEPVEAATAFLVFTTKEGQTMISLDVNIPLVVERQPLIGEVKGALHVCLDDLNNQETAALAANNVIMHQMQLAARVADAQANNQILQKLPSGLAG